VLEHTHLRSERVGATNSVVLLQDHDVSNARHVLLNKTLNVESTVVARGGRVDDLVMHFDGEDLSLAWRRDGVGWQEDDFLSRLDGSLLDTASQHVTNTLDLVDSGDGSTSGRGGDSLGNGDELLEAIEESFNVNGDLSLLDVGTLPPRHVGGFGDQVVSLPAGDWEERNGIGDKVLQPAVAGGLIGLMNVGLLGYAGYLFYTRPGYRSDYRIIGGTVAGGLALLAAEGALTEAYLETPEGQQEKQRAQEEGAAIYRQTKEVVLRPGVFGGLLGLVNVGILGGLGYYTYLHYDDPVWDRRWVVGTTAGLLALFTGQGVLAESYREKEYPKRR